jgi:hypothetical protein
LGILGMENHPNWRTQSIIFQRGRVAQPPTSHLQPSLTIINHYSSPLTTIKTTNQSLIYIVVYSYGPAALGLSMVQWLSPSWGPSRKIPTCHQRAVNSLGRCVPWRKIARFNTCFNHRYIIYLKWVMFQL